MATVPQPEIEDPRAGRVTVERAKEMLAQIDMPDSAREEILKEVALANALQDHIMAAAERVRNGEAVTREKLFQEMNRVAEEHGCEYGIPFVAVGTDKEYPLILAKRSPLKILEANNWQTEAMQRWAVRGFITRNSWERLGDETVTIIQSDTGPFAVKEWHAGSRLRKIINELDIRQLSQQSVEAEEKALRSLREKVNENQYRTYFLTGTFLERSNRSDLHYIFRKGKPTLALSFHGKYANDGGHILAALCMHPMGYYGFSHVGVMCPTDEIIAALLLMRGNEPRLWKVSGQWKAIDPRSGI